MGNHAVQPGDVTASMMLLFFLNSSIISRTQAGCTVKEADRQNINIWKMY